MSNVNEQVVTTTEVFEALGIDYADDIITRNVERMIKSADAYLKGSIGKNYPVSDPRAKELALVIIADLYDNRNLTTPTNNTRRLIEDFSLQLRLEMAGGTNG